MEATVQELSEAHAWSYRLSSSLALCSNNNQNPFVEDISVFTLRWMCLTSLVQNHWESLHIKMHLLAVESAHIKVESIVKTMYLHFSTISRKWLSNITTAQLLCYAFPPQSTKYSQNANGMYTEASAILCTRLLYIKWKHSKKKKRFEYLTKQQHRT